LDFTNPYFPAWFSYFTNGVSVVLVLLVISSLARSYKQKVYMLNPWLWCIFLVACMWFLRASLVSGINMHLSGAMLMTLMFGLRLGFLGMCLVIFATCFFNDAFFINLGVSVLLNALLPVTLLYSIFLLLEAKLPRNFFIYIFGSAFFGTWVTSMIMGFITALCLLVFGAFEWSLLRQEFLPYYFLMGFSESFLTAGLITLFVVYRPAWVYSFRDQRYLDGK
jgi:uncharacterized membrane protein